MARVDHRQPKQNAPFRTHLSVVWRRLEDFHDEVLAETAVEAGGARDGDGRRRVVRYLKDGHYGVVSTFQLIDQSCIEEFARLHKI